MTIQISRNAAGNCITFAGATQPAYWNACLSAQLNADNNARVNVINDIRSAAQGEIFYEFYAVDPAGFSNADGDVFASAQEMVDHINAVGNVQGTSDVGLDLNAETAVNFRLDETSTSILMSTGHAFGVNTIKAVADTDGTIHIQAIGEGLPEAADSTVVEKEHFQKLVHTAVQVNGVAVSGGLNDVVNTLNELFTVGAFTSVVIQDPESTVIADVAGVAATYTTPGSNSVDPVGVDILGTTATHNNAAGLLSDDYIDQAGEYFTFDIAGKATYGFGLVHTQQSYDDGHWSGNQSYADPAGFCVGANSAHLGYQFAHHFHIGNVHASWTNYGANTGYVMGPAWHSHNTEFDLKDEWNAGDPVKVKVGIDTNGFIEVATLADDGVSWKLHARSSYPVPEGFQGRLGIKLATTGARLRTAPKKHLLTPAAPTMNFRYIESPDGVYQYPIFTTEAEAEYYDQNHNGTTGSGTSHTHVFVDDATATTWYMPDTGATMNGSDAPTSATTFQGTPINWTEITSLSNADLVPSAFAAQTIQVNELAAVNINVHPAGASWTTTVDVGTSGLTYDSVGGFVVGTAPEVTGDNVANPSDDYTLDVTRTNSYGSSTGTLTVRVNNLTQPVTAISGFTHDNTSAAMVDSDTMGDGAAVHVHNTLDVDKRFVITQDYIETNILPNLLATGDKYYIGIPVGSHDFATISDSDWDAAIVWEYETATSHSFKFIDNGTVVQNIVVNSATDAFYDYAIEAQSTSECWLIACNINSINTELSPADGGSFSHTREVTGMDSTEPHTIHMAVVSTTGDISTTGISEIDVPTAPATLTNWTKALDFSGGSEYALMVSSNTSNQPIAQPSGITIANASSTNTAALSSARPWATAVVFRIDGNASNQHIWNQGEGSGSTDDNIYLRLDSSRNLYFGWGRTGALNELHVAANLQTTQWYGCYVGFTGERLSGANATAANLAGVFDVHFFSSGTNWQIASAPNSSTETNWGLAGSTTGGRMDRTIAGNFTIGGRGGNRNFHGKVASCVSTTLRLNVPMPTTTEIEMMVTDPQQWVQDYKVGQTWRRTYEGTNSTNFQIGSTSGIWYPSNATQVWLMGDGSNDGYANGIRNQINQADQNYTKLNLNSMVSNDIENVTIPGLS